MFQSESEESANCVIAVRDEPLADACVYTATDSITIVSRNIANDAASLFQFASETATAPARSKHDALVQYPSAARHDTPTRLAPIIVRWVLPAVAAFVIGATSVLAVLHQRGSTANDTLAPISNARIDPAIVPRVQTGISSSALRTLSTVEVQGLASRTTVLVAPRRTDPETTRLATRRAAAVPSMPAAPPLEVVPIPKVLNGPPGDLTYADAIDSPAPLTVENAMSRAADEFAIRRALHLYEAAYEGLDVAAAAQIWPTVDRRVLSRAFAALKSQVLEFHTCGIKVQDANATAYCRGTLVYVRKAGNPAPVSAEQLWVFKMRRDGAAWKIDDVSATQAASTNGTHP